MEENNPLETNSNLLIEIGSRYSQPSSIEEEYLQNTITQLSNPQENPPSIKDKNISYLLVGYKKGYEDDLSEEFKRDRGYLQLQIAQYVKDLAFSEEEYDQLKYRVFWGINSGEDTANDELIEDRAIAANKILTLISENNDTDTVLNQKLFKEVFWEGGLERASEAEYIFEDRYLLRNLLYIFSESQFIKIKENREFLSKEMIYAIERLYDFKGIRFLVDFSDDIEDLFRELFEQGWSLTEEVKDSILENKQLQRKLIQQDVQLKREWGHNKHQTPLEFLQLSIEGFREKVELYIEELIRENLIEVLENLGEYEPFKEHDLLSLNSGLYRKIKLINSISDDKELLSKVIGQEFNIDSQYSKEVIYPLLESLLIRTEEFYKEENILWEKYIRKEIDQALNTVGERVGILEEGLKEKIADRVRERILKCRHDLQRGGETLGDIEVDMRVIKNGLFDRLHENTEKINHIIENYDAVKLLIDLYKGNKIKEDFTQ